MKRVVIVAALLLPAGAFAEPDVVTAGDLRVTFAIDPDPPTTGENRLNVTVADAAGKPVNGAKLGLVWDMPAMGSMAEMKGGGDVAAKGAGRYVITYPLAMNGD